MIDDAGVRPGSECREDMGIRLQHLAAGSAGRAIDTTPDPDSPEE
jgi:hypothetical protein